MKPRFLPAFLATLLLGLVLRAAPPDPQAQLGNIFLDHEPVTLLSHARGNSVTYSIRDFGGNEVASGTAPVENGIAVVKPDLKSHGYFELTINPGTDNRLLTFAILAPVDFAGLADSPFNVCSHFVTAGWNEDLMALLPRLGIPQVREDLPWRWVETTREGMYDFGANDHRLDKIHDDLRKLGVSELPVAAYCDTRLYDHSEFPTSQHGFDGFARFCVAALQHFPDFKQIELWNEYNGSWGPPKEVPPAQRPALYAQMEKTVYDAVKQSRPDVEVLGGAMVRVPLPYMESFCKAGGLDHLDGLVVHPYIGEPEVFWRTFNGARALMKTYNHGQEKPTWATEYSWGGWETRDIRQHADFLVRGSVLLLAENVNRMYWFELRDSPAFNGGQGLLHSDTDPRGKYSPAPAAVAMATLIRELHDARYEAREAVTPFTRAWVFRFHTAQGEVRVCWSSGREPVKIALDAGSPLTRVDVMGNETPVAPENGRATLELSETPFFLKGSAGGVREIPSPWRTIANSVDDAGDTQGANGWHAGYFAGAPGPAPESLAANSFTEMTLNTDNWGYRWAGPGDCRVSEESDLWTSAKALPSIRWVSTTDGKISLRGSFTVMKGAKDPFQTMESAIYLNGKSVFAKETPTTEPGGTHTYTAPFEIPIEVKTGDTIDFTVPAAPTGAMHPRVDASICVPNPDYRPASTP